MVNDRKDKDMVASGLGQVTFMPRLNSIATSHIKNTSSADEKQSI